MSVYKPSGSDLGLTSPAAEKIILDMNLRESEKSPKST